jgi:hypothetical protein
MTMVARHHSVAALPSRTHRFTALRWGIVGCALFWAAAAFLAFQALS